MNWTYHSPTIEEWVVLPAAAAVASWLPMDGLTMALAPAIATKLSPQDAAALALSPIARTVHAERLIKLRAESNFIVVSPSEIRAIEESAEQILALLPSPPVSRSYAPVRVPPQCKKAHRYDISTTRRKYMAALVLVDSLLTAVAHWRHNPATQVFGVWPKSPAGPMGTMKTSTARSALFGPYSLDLRSGELRKFDTKVKMGEQSFHILCLLLNAQGEMVTREELRTKLWPSDTFVDFDHGLNSAVQRLRDCLSDSAENPRWIETVPRRGYRFVGQVEWQNENGTATAPVKATESHQTVEAPSRTSQAIGKVTRRWVVAGILILVATALGIGYWVRTESVKRQAVRTIRSLAVLPLENLSGDPGQDYFADGMTDELTTMLAKNRSLRVVSRTSSMQYKGAKRPLPEIARELNVDGILEGSVARSPNRVHMTVQLIYAPNDSHVWAESYDRDLNQAYSLPSELSATIAKEVKIATSSVAPQRYVNPEAHDAYLHGRYFWFTTLDAHLTLPYFQKAIELQPDYAAAWSGLADTYALEGMGVRPPIEVSEKVHSAALKALELDPSLVEAHTSMAAWLLFYAWDPGQAEAEARRGIALDPNYAELHHLLSYILEVENRYAEGEVEAKRQTELDPFIHPWELGTYYMSERKFDQAVQELKLQNAAHPQDSDILFDLSGAYWLEGKYPESQDAYERALGLQNGQQKKEEAHKVWLAGGEPAVERWGAEQIKAQARKQYFEPEFEATVIAYTGDKEETLKYLEASYRNHDPDLVFLQNQPEFDFLHSDPRYQALVKKIGLTPAY